jgi:hypothetical protein
VRLGDAYGEDEVGECPRRMVTVSGRAGPVQEADGRLARTPFRTDRQPLRIWPPQPPLAVYASGRGEDGRPRRTRETVRLNRVGRTVSPGWRRRDPGGVNDAAEVQRVAGQMFQEVLRRALVAPAPELAAMVAKEARRTGAQPLVLYLLDREQKLLVPLPGDAAEGREPIPSRARWPVAPSSRARSSSSTRMVIAGCGLAVFDGMGAGWPPRA